MQDLIFKKTQKRDLHIKIYGPIKKIYDKAPLYFLIPGGGWHTENIDDMVDFVSIVAEILQNSGYAVAGIDYRIASDGVIMSEIIDDCFDALAYVTNNAEKLNIDKNNIITCGHSAGGHLALMLAYLSKKRCPNCTIKVAAVMSPPTILNGFETHNLRDIDDVFSGADKDAERKKASPYEYVTSDCPPTFLSAGTSDRLVFCNSSELLYKKLKENGVDTELVISVCGGHCFEQMHDGITPNPSNNEIQRKMADFILKYAPGK